MRQNYHKVYNFTSALFHAKKPVLLPVNITEPCVAKMLSLEYFTPFRDTSISFQNKRNPYPESSLNHVGSLFCPVLFCSGWICSVLFCSVLYCSVLLNTVWLIIERPRKTGCQFLFICSFLNQKVELTTYWTFTQDILDTKCLKNCIKARSSITDKHGDIRVWYLFHSFSAWKGRVYDWNQFSYFILRRAELSWNFSSSLSDTSNIYRFPTVHTVPASCLSICEYQNHPGSYWKNSDVARLSLI